MIVVVVVALVVVISCIWFLDSDKVGILVCDPTVLLVDDPLAAANNFDFLDPDAKMRKGLAVPVTLLILIRLDFDLLTAALVAMGLGDVLIWPTTLATLLSTGIKGGGSVESSM